MTDRVKGFTVTLEKDDKLIEVRLNGVKENFSSSIQKNGKQLVFVKPDDKNIQIKAIQ